jgi:hypothetical protein
VKRDKIKSSVIVVGLLLAFILGGVAVSLGQDSLSVGPVSALGWHPSRPARTSPDDYTLHVGLSAESGIVPAFFARAAQGISLLAEPLNRSGLVAVFDGPIGWKVSLHLLVSVLLI